MPRAIVILAIIVVSLIGCKKSTPHTSTGTTPPNQPPVVTPVGTPVGTPFTKTIGPAGGTILSADGRLQLTFPPNALTTNTDITIQPGTNNGPGGKGVAYHLMPDGTTFAVPVTLTFNYTDSDAFGTIPYFFYIAFQDSTGVWNADFKNRNIDTVARTASTQISHFSWWEMGAKYSMYAYPFEVKEKKTSTLGVEYTQDGNMARNPGGEFSYTKLAPTITPVPSEIIGDWSIDGVPDGDAENGTLSQDNNTETYTAPDEIDEERTVQASGTLIYDNTAWNNGQKVTTTAKVTLFTPIDLLPSKFSFIVTVSILAYNTSGVYNDRYYDSASFRADIDLGDSSFVFSGFANMPADVTPQNGSDGTTRAAWIIDDIGLTNVTGGLGVIRGDSILILLNQSNTIEPDWLYTNITSGDTWTNGGDAVPGYPTVVTFALTNKAQKGSFVDLSSITESWSATPIK